MNSRPESAPGDASGDQPTRRAPPPAGSAASEATVRAPSPSQDAGDPTRVASQKPAERIGPYKPTKRLGGGGMGQIFLATHDSTSAQVALKVLRSGFLEDEGALERFRREFHLLRQLQHDHICPVLDAGVEGTIPWYAMEYLRGQDLARVVRTQRVEPRRAAAIAVQVARALQAAHDRGIVHRDVKPHNVMLVRGAKPRADTTAPVAKSSGMLGRLFGRRSGPRADSAGSRPAGSADLSSSDPHMPSPEFEDRAVLIDFGLARGAMVSGATKLTVTGEVVGTPAYMAPEQAQGLPEKIGPLTDVYSLGATLYEMLTLQAPFTGATMAAILHDVVHADPPPPRRLVPMLDRDLETIVLKAMEKEPTRRYPSAAAFADDLQRWLDGQSIRARPPGLAWRLRRIVSRNRVASAAVAASLALAAAGAWRFYRPGRLEIAALSPIGAEVVVDGSPVRGGIERVWPPASVAVVVRSPGYDDWRSEIAVGPGENVPLSVALVPSWGSLTVESDPPGAAVFLDGVEIGATPLSGAKARTGRHELRLRLANHEGVTEAPVVLPGQDTAVSRTLRHETGTLTFTSEPPEAAVELLRDGDEEPLTAAAPSSALAVDTGAWRGTARARNHFPRSFEFRLEAGGRFRRHLTLNPMLQWQQSCPRGTRCLVAADVDGDAVPDLVELVGNARKLSAYSVGKGALLWETDIPRLYISHRVTMVVADLDGDFAPEIVVPMEEGKLGLFDGATGRARRPLPAAGVHEIQEAGDLDGDHLPDLIAMQTGLVQAIRGRTGDVLWTAEGPARSRMYVAAGTFDGDEAPDFAVVWAMSQVQAVSGRDGRVLWTDLVPLASAPVLADVNDDGADDLLCATVRPDRLFAVSGRDDTLLWKTPVDEAALTVGGAAADLDGDGTVEWIRKGNGGLMVVDASTGRVRATLAMPTSWGPAALLDVTSDGVRDILVPSNEALVAIDGRTLKPAWRFYADGPVYEAPLLADFDNDGRQDIALSVEAGQIAVIAAEPPPILWKQPAVQHNADSVPVLGDPPDALLAPGWGPIRLLNPADGGVKRAFAVGGSEVATAAASPSGRLAFLGGRVQRCVDLETGLERWSVAAGQTGAAPEPFDVNADGVPDMLVGDANTNVKMAAYDGRDGTPIWKDGPERATRGRMAVSGGLLWVPTDRAVVGIEPATGRTVAAIPAASHVYAVWAVEDDLLFATAQGHLVRCSRPAAGGGATRRWEVVEPTRITERGPLVTRTFVFVSHRHLGCTARDLETGRTLWTSAEATDVNGQAARDIDGDGREEVAGITADATIVVLDGRDGRLLWKYKLDTEVGYVSPSWLDLDGDGDGELLAAFRDGFIYAFEIRPGSGAVETWPTRDHRTAAAAARASAPLRLRLESDAARRASRWDDVVAVAGRAPDAVTAMNAAFACLQLKDTAKALEWARRARHLGCRRLDLCGLHASLVPPIEGADVLAGDLREVSPEAVLDYWPPDRERDVWDTAVASLLKTADLDVELRIAVAAHTRSWQSVLDACPVIPDGDPGGRVRLARGRAAMRLRFFEEARNEFTAAVASPSAATEALEELRAMTDQAAVIRKKASMTMLNKNHYQSAVLFREATALDPSDPAGWRGLAEALLSDPHVNRFSALEALAHARRAHSLHKASTPDDRAGLGAILDTMSAGLHAVGQDVEAAMKAREALGCPLMPEQRERVQKRLEEIEKKTRK